MPVARFFEQPRVKRQVNKVILWLRKFLDNPQNWWEQHKYTMTLVVIVLVAIGAFTQWGDMSRTALAKEGERRYLKREPRPLL